MSRTPPEVPGKDVLVKLCSQLSLPNDLPDAAWSLFLEICSLDDGTINGFDKGQPDDWYAIILYLTLLRLEVSAMSTSQKVTVSDILQVTNLQYKEFFIKMGEFVKAVVIPDKLQTAALQLQRRFLTQSWLFNKFNKITQELFTDCQLAPGMPAIDTHSGSELEERKKLIWLIYNVARERILNDGTDLYKCFYILLISCATVVKSVPAFMLKRPFDLYLKNVGDNTALLMKLCEVYKADFTEVQQQVLADSAFWDGVGQTESIELTSKWKSFLAPLSIDYMDFIDSENFLTPTRSRSDNPSSSIPDTPVQSRLSIISRLKLLLEGCKPTPSATLLDYFQACEDNPSDHIDLWLAEMRDRFVNASIVKSIDNGISEQRANQNKNAHIQRFSTVTTMYYKVLLSLLQQEESRLDRKDFSNLLHKDTFHRTLIVCCYLVVDQTYSDRNYNTNSTELLLHLTWTLDTFRVEAYHMCKVIECFIKSEPALSTEVIQHLSLVESRILDTLAWQKNSPLFEVLANQTLPSGSAIAGDRGTQSHYISLLMSPAKVKRDLPAVENGRPPRYKTLEVFIHKVSRLAYSRLSKLTARLDLQRELMLQMWTCIEHCITSQYVLLLDRHLDQIIICSVVGICKSRGLGPDFDKITSTYSDMDFCPGKAVLTQVFINKDKGYKTIEKFYNEVFLPEMKSYLSSFTDKATTPEMSAPPKAGFSPLKASPHRVHHTVFVSPMKGAGTPNKVQMTPRTKRLYHFGNSEGSSQLQSINHSLHLSSLTISTPASNPSGLPVKPEPSKAKRLKFE